MKAALYIRVSTQEQVENYSITTQRERLEAFCKSKGWLIYDIYTDPGYSGSNIDRPDLKRMLNDLDKFDTVVVYRLDRLSRSQRDTLTLIEDYFLKNSVDFVSITETLDTSTPFGKAMIGILSVFAQLERETITERMRNGLIKRAQEGYRVAGGNYDPAGYKTLENGDLEIIPEEAEHIKKAADLYEQYHSITKVQNKLKELGYPVWRFRRYRDILPNWLYAGYVSFAGEYYKGRHQPILSSEQIKRIRALFDRHPGNNVHRAKESLFSGLITCGKCGESYVTWMHYEKGRKYRYYTCRARRFPAEYDKKCMNSNWNGKKLEKLIVQEINNLTIEKRLGDKRTPKIDYDKQLKKIDAKMERIIDLYADPEGGFEKSLLDKQVKKLNREKSLIIKKRQMKEEQEKDITPEQLKQYSIDLASADFPEKQAVIQKLIRGIVIKGESVEIEWNF